MALGECYGLLTGADLADPDALQLALQTCTGALLDPGLWAWALGINLACAVIGALLGLAKGRWLAGLVWGAVLGPIGWLVIVLSKSGLVECPDCGRGNGPDAKVCRQCGVNLRAASTRSTRATHKRNDSGRGW